MHVRRLLVPPLLSQYPLPNAEELVIELMKLPQDATLKPPKLSFSTQSPIRK